MHSLLLMYRYSGDVHLSLVICAGETIATELYDHRGDDGRDFNAWENVNLAQEPALAPIVSRLRAALAAQFSQDD